MLFNDVRLKMTRLLTVVRVVRLGCLRRHIRINLWSPKELYVIRHPVLPPSICWHRHDFLIFVMICHGINNAITPAGAAASAAATAATATAAAAAAAASATAAAAQLQLQPQLQPSRLVFVLPLHAGCFRFSYLS